jgi:hypothetical protein
VKQESTATGRVYRLSVNVKIAFLGIGAMLLEQMKSPFVLHVNLDECPIQRLVVRPCVMIAMQENLNLNLLPKHLANLARLDISKQTLANHFVKLAQLDTIKMLIHKPNVKFVQKVITRVSLHKQIVNIAQQVLIKMRSVNQFACNVSLENTAIKFIKKYVNNAT